MEACQLVHQLRSLLLQTVEEDQSTRSKDWGKIKKNVYKNSWNDMLLVLQNANVLTDLPDNVHGKYSSIE